MKNVLENYKVSLISRNERIETNKELDKRVVCLFNKLLEEREVKGLNIEITRISRKGFGFYFVDFSSTNNKTLEQNIKNYFKQNSEDRELVKMIKRERELKNNLLKDIENFLNN